MNFSLEEIFDRRLVRYGHVFRTTKIYMRMDFRRAKQIQANRPWGLGRNFRAEKRDNFDNSLSKCVLTNHMNHGNTGNPRNLQFTEFFFSADKN